MSWVEGGKCRVSASGPAWSPPHPFLLQFTVCISIWTEQCEPLEEPQGARGQAHALPFLSCPGASVSAPTCVPHPCGLQGAPPPQEEMGHVGKSRALGPVCKAGLWWQVCTGPPWASCEPGPVRGGGGVCRQCLGWWSCSCSGPGDTETPPDSGALFLGWVNA